jgi:anti-sigma regulatory factor (Ser/Thr protein kinase)
MSPRTGQVTPADGGLRWRHVFRGDEAQIRELRRWLAGLLPDCATRDDVMTVAVELATNTVKHTASGRGGWFAAEVTWHPAAVRIVVADQGAPTGPQLIDDPMAESGRGMVVVRELSARTGVAGDERGRLVWAEVTWTGDAAAPPAGFPDGCEAAIRDGQQLLAVRHSRAVTWFGRATMQWWALAGYPGSDHLVAADSPQELSRRLDALQALTTPRMPTATAAAGPAAAVAARRDRRRKVPVPPRLQGATPPGRIRVQPC